MLARITTRLRVAHIMMYRFAKNESTARDTARDTAKNENTPSLTAEANSPAVTKKKGRSNMTSSKEMQDSLDGILSKQQFYNVMGERFDKLQHLNDDYRLELLEKVRIPYLLCGVRRTAFKEEYGYIPDRIMSYYNIPQNTVTDYLLKIYKASIYAMVEKNLPFMDEYWENGFKEETLKSMDELKESNYTLLVAHQRQYLESLQERARIVDSVLIRGVSMDREKNNPPKEYHRYEEDDEVGLVTYTPLHLTYNNENFIDPEKNKKVYDGYQQAVMRVLLLVRSPLRLIVPQIEIPEQVDTNEHIALFECQMEAPPPLQSSYKTETLLEWLGKHRFGQWKLVDIDNFMEGNSLFRKHQPVLPMDPIFKGSELDRKFFANIRKL